MKLRFGEKDDSLYFRLTDSNIIESEEVRPGLILDFDEKGQVIGFELLKVKSRIPLSSLHQMIFEVS
jgi:uncharacterized protein YuzE